MKDSSAVAIALAHIKAWGCHDWDKTRELLAPDVHASVTSTQRQFGGGEFAGVDNYMERKIKGAQLVEPGSVQVLSAIGDEHNALITVTMKFWFVGAHRLLAGMIAAPVQCLGVPS